MWSKSNALRTAAFANTTMKTTGSQEAIISGPTAIMDAIATARYFSPVPSANPIQRNISVVRKPILFGLRTRMGENYIGMRISS
jgi:hypothetical protein